MLQKLGRFIFGLNRICATLAGLILLFVTGAIFVDVFLRYFFDSPSIWVTEISSYLFLYVIFFAVSYALDQGLHIRVSFALDRLSPKANQILNTITYFFSLLFSVVLLWQTSLMTLEAYEGSWTTPTLLSTPYAYIYLSMIIGSFILVLTTLTHLLLTIYGIKPADSEAG
jgi:TRAP-type C4-dicarboxylate transport system permease small subunit